MKNDSIGIDISKARLDVHRLSDARQRAFDNTPAGFGALRKWLSGSQPARVVYEATGAYHRAFERSCAAHLPLVKVNPLQARRFAQASGVRAKTDVADARVLAAMGEAFSLQPDRPTSEDQLANALIRDDRKWVKYPT